jgi:hypothetical protein
MRDKSIKSFLRTNTHEVSRLVFIPKKVLASLKKYNNLINHKVYLRRENNDNKNVEESFWENGKTDVKNQ